MKNQTLLAFFSKYSAIVSVQISIIFYTRSELSGSMVLGTQLETNSCFCVIEISPSRCGTGMFKQTHRLWHCALPLVTNVWQFEP